MTNKSVGNNVNIVSRLTLSFLLSDATKISLHLHKQCSMNNTRTCQRYRIVLTDVIQANKAYFEVVK